MSVLCKPLNPLQRDGTSQRQRLVQALSPSFVSVDERDLNDLLLYAHQYAGLLRYYTTSNSLGGDWVEFIEHDVSTLVSLIGGTDHAATKADFQETLRDLAQAPTLPEMTVIYASLFPRILDLSRQFDLWYRDSIEGLSLRTSLSRLIGSVLSDTLRALLAQASRSQEVGIPVEIDAEGYSDIWNIDGVSSDPSFFPSGVPISEGDISTAAENLARLFDRFHEALVFVVNGAPDQLQETLDSYPRHQPQMALFLSFLQIFRIAQDHLNLLTAKHLNFYYEKVLQLRHSPPTPDQVHIVFELARNASPHRVGTETLLKAGKDATGIDLLYSTSEELVVSPAALDETHGLKTIFVDKDDSGTVRNIYSGPDADSEDGEGADIEDEEGKWETFGSIDRPAAEIGFAVSSPLFLLAEGTRRIGVAFHFDSPLDRQGLSKKEVRNELQYNVRVSASGEKGWLDLEVTDVSIGTSSIEYELKLGAGEAPIVAYDDKVLLAGFSAESPVLRFVLDNRGLSSANQFDLSQATDVEEYSPLISSYDRGSLVRHEDDVYRALMPIDEAGFSPPDYPDRWDLIEPSYAYKYFAGLELTRLEISVSVGALKSSDTESTGMKNLLLENDLGVLDPAKPFFPFGPSPRSGSSFLVGSPEVFQKRLDTLRLQIEWADLPLTNFATHYNLYGDPAIITGNGYFTAALEFLHGGTWAPTEDSSQELFEPSGGSKKPKPSRTLQSAGLAFEPDPDLPEFHRFGSTLRQGFLRLRLETSFLHSMYPTLLATAASGPGAIPNQPYTPLMAGLALSYKAAETIDFSCLTADDFEDRVERIFQIAPFGQAEIFPVAGAPQSSAVPVERKLLPEFKVTRKNSAGATWEETAEGTLYFGLANLKPPQNLSLLFQVAEGSEDPTLPAQEIVWSYLAGNRWVDFGTPQILADKSDGLTTSGVVKFDTPKVMTDSNTLLPSGLHWIKASVATDSAAVPRLIDVRTQAVAAVFADNGNDPGHLAQPLPADTISKLKTREAAIKSVSQPYASFGGRMEESDEGFHIRVSERLRHKARAITIFDYERLVLEEFPEVYKVKCINHTSEECEFDPGYVKLVVVPDLRNKNAVDPLQPRLSLNKRERIRASLREVASDFATVEVANPDYEEIQVNFAVLFQKGRDKGLYTSQLNQDIIKFLSPWLYDDVADLTFGGRIHRSWILNHVEKLDYIDFVTDFRLDHRTAHGTSFDVEEARATSSSSALVSAPEHVIGHILSTCRDPGGPELLPPDAGAPPAPHPPKAKGYLGNVRTRELHDLANLTPQCQIDEIDIDRRYRFETVVAAKEMGYDVCAYCFSREESKR